MAKRIIGSRGTVRGYNSLVTLVGHLNFRDPTPEEKSYYNVEAVSWRIAESKTSRRWVTVIAEPTEITVIDHLVGEEWTWRTLPGVNKRR